jgi:adenylate kinase
MNIVFIGPQGCGKGTQARIVSEKLDIPHISTGDLLRGATGKLKDEVDFYMVRGDLVPDDLIFRVLKRRLKKEDCKKGFILDGFPRNLNQAERLCKTVVIDRIIEIYIRDDEAVSRVLGRLNCQDCGKIYNLNSNPKPKKEGVCDKCGGRLVKRMDDNEVALRERLRLYHKKTKLILDKYYSIRINGEQPINKVTKDIMDVLRQYYYNYYSL